MTLLQETLEIKVHYFTKKGPTQCHQISWGHQQYNEIKGLLRTQTIFHGNGHGCWKETYHMTLTWSSHLTKICICFVWQVVNLDYHLDLCQVAIYFSLIQLAFQIPSCSIYRLKITEIISDNGLPFKLNEAKKYMLQHVIYCFCITTLLLWSNGKANSGKLKLKLARWTSEISIITKNNSLLNYKTRDN